MGEYDPVFCRLRGALDMGMVELGKGLEDFCMGN